MAQLSNCVAEYQTSVECSERYPPVCTERTTTLHENCKPHEDAFQRCVSDDPLTACIVVIGDCSTCVCQTCACNGVCLEQHDRWRACHKACTTSAELTVCQQDCDAFAEPELRASLDCLAASGSGNCDHVCAP